MQCGWGNVKQGTLKKAQFDRDGTFQAEITLDLKHGKAILVVGDTRVEFPLPAELESVTHVGIYAKGTASEFTMPKLVSP